MFQCKSSTKGIEYRCRKEIGHSGMHGYYSDEVFLEWY